MPEPVIVPPIPTVAQPGPVDNSPGLEQVQRAFDQAYPDLHPQKTEAPPEPQPVPPPPPSETPPPVEDKPMGERTMPSFLEDPTAPQPQPAEAQPEEWPEELPAEASEKAKANYRKWRGDFQKLKAEAEQLRSRPMLDEATQQRMASLENQNRQMGEVLQRMGVEQHVEFQQKIIQPMNQAWQSAARIVQEAGGDPNKLAQAVQLQGKEHFEALDEVFEELPESAKMEAHQAIAAYKRLDKARQQALAEAPKTYEALHKKDLERQYQTVTEQRKEMSNMLDEAVRTLREDAKVEVLRKTADPQAAWWNDQADSIVNVAKQLYLENTDMRRMAMAVLMAPMADVYRKLWLAERDARSKQNNMVKERFGAEPYIGSSSGGGNGASEGGLAADLKKPFSEVFLREFHKAQARNR